MFVPLILLSGPGNLDTILADERLRGAVVSATVTDLSGRPLYVHNSEARIMPASNMKLFTCAFAMHTLGPDYRPKTKFWRTDNAITIEAPGDPSLTYKRLKEASASMKADFWTAVYLREAYAPGVPQSWEYDDLPNKYAAQVSAFTVDKGSFELWNVNGKFKLLPYNYGVRIETLNSPTEFIRYDPILRKVIASKKLPVKTERIDTLAIPRPDESACSLFGRLRGGVEALPTTPPTLVIEGKSIAENIGDCIPPSDNNIAENLFLMSAAKDSALGADPYAVARDREQKFVESVVGIPKNHVRVYDGSGMSRHNLATTAAIARLLCWADQQPTRSQWRSAMAYPGKGTLKTRLPGIGFLGKTGSLDMVVSLSGYLKAKDGRELAVSIAINHFLCTDDEARALMDLFVKTLREADL